MPLVDYKEALKLLTKGEVVAVPTETVYGLAGRIDSEYTVRKIFQIKKRPFSDPLIVHFYDSIQMRNYVEEEAPFVQDLWQAFSPGPLTIVLKKKDSISPLITHAKKQVASRVPRHPLIRKLLHDLKVPLAAPSANRFSEVSPTKAKHVLSAFAQDIPVLDGGPCEIGLESTLIKLDLKNKKIIILRPGSIAKNDIENFLKKRKIPFQCEFKDASFFPGGSKKHYSPSVPLVIVESEKSREEVIQFLLKKFPNKKIQTFLFDSSVQKTASLLYEQLRSLSQKESHLICVQKKLEQTSPPWKAIWNRLEKASSFYFRF